MASLETISSIDTAPRHPIRLVANRTGLTVDLIRAWEKRYHVVDPARSDTKRRLYSDYDIERLRLIRIAKQNGRRLADVAPLTLEALRDVVSEDSRYDQAQDNQAEIYRPSWTSPLESSDTQDDIDAMLFAVQTMDQHRFDQLLQEGLVKQSLPAYLETVIGPLLREIGESTRLGKLRIAHEHMATAHLRTFIGALRFRETYTGNEPKIVITTPTGQLHELGALMIAALVSVDGWLPVYLGPNTPADEIVACALQSGARVVSLSLTYPADDPRIPTELTRLRTQLDGKIPVFIGGSAAAYHQPLIDRLGLIAPATLNGLRQSLNALRDRGYKERTA
jgi:DNA-binding transcriptional MerR regulator/methylmalonyl-CoA mutase cobalamin-binding subunit